MISISKPSEYLEGIRTNAGEKTKSDIGKECEKEEVKISQICSNYRFHNYLFYLEK